MKAERMLQTHPRHSQIDGESLASCIEACFARAQACTSCADACLTEEQVQDLVRCIRLNVDCADVCETTGRLLSRQTDTEWALVRRQVTACAEICASERHGGHHEHCRVCVEVCRRCEEACGQLLSAIRA